jgi:hypothetical protein
MTARRTFALLWLAALGLMLAPTGNTQAQEGYSPEAVALASTFTYQGYVEQNGIPLTATCDFQFALFDALNAGAQVGSTLTRTNVGVNAGVFAVQLSFGATAFDGQDRYLRIALRCPAGSGTYTTLAPRQAVTPAPYAMVAIRNWALAGNAGTTPASQFIGTTDNVALEIRVNNLRIMRFAPSAISPNLIGGFNGNTVTGGAFGATIAGGGSNALTNRVTDDFGTVSGGQNNQAGDNTGSTSDRAYGTVGGGIGNIASGTAATVNGGLGNIASGSYTTVSGGSGNFASGEYASVGGGSGNSASGTSATVGGGFNNSATGTFDATVGGGFGNTASGNAATIGGGQNNNASGVGTIIGGGVGNSATANFATIGGGGPSNLITLADGNRVTDDYGTVGGGANNRAGDDAGTTIDRRYATVSGGVSNTASGEYATIGGGSGNSASGTSATVGGGFNNTVSGTFDATVGGGFGNTASGNNATVGGGATNTASGNSSMVGGGSGNTASGSYATVAGGFNNTASGNASFSAGYSAGATHERSFVWSGSFSSADSWGDGTFTARAPGGVRFYSSNTGITTGVQLPSGGGAWASLSDRDAKANFETVDARAVLTALLDLPITTWNYLAQDENIRHLGPIAQDFYAAFGVGEDQTRITTVDADGVAFAAIQGLYQVVQEENTILREQNEALEARIAALEALVNGGQAGGQASAGLPLALGALLAVGGIGAAAVQRRKGALE